MSLTRLSFLATLLVALTAASAQAQRATPALTTPGPIAAGAIEQGPVGVTQILTLQGINYGGEVKANNHDLLLYNEHTGHAWFVYNKGILYGQFNYSPNVSTPQHECVVFAPLAPGLKLTATKIDDDLVDDIVGVRADGKIFRYYRRGWPGCP